MKPEITDMDLIHESWQKGEVNAVFDRFGKSGGLREENGIVVRSVKL